MKKQQNKNVDSPSCQYYAFFATVLFSFSVLIFCLLFVALMNRKLEKELGS